MSASHFGVHGQETEGFGPGMQGPDLDLYRELRLDGTFARTGIGSPGDYVNKGPRGQYDYVDDGTDLTTSTCRNTSSTAATGFWTTSSGSAPSR